MRTYRIDYTQTSREELDEILQSATEEDRAVVVQKPTEESARELLGDEGLDVSEQSGGGPGQTALDTFESLVDRLEREGVDYRVVEVDDTMGGIEQWDGVEALVFAVMSIPLVLFLPVSYVLHKLGKDELQQRLTRALAIGRVGDVLDSGAGKIRRKLETESDAVERDTGRQPIVVSQKWVGAN